jgi:hypothetical protein
MRGVIGACVMPPAARRRGSRTQASRLLSPLKVDNHWQQQDARGSLILFSFTAHAHQ